MKTILLTPLCLATIFAARTEAARPNVLFILVDDMGWGDLGANGGAGVPTPGMDRLAREGTRFTRFYVASPICSPSRCGFITGQFPARWRITSYLQTRAGNRQCDQADFLDPRAPSFVRAFKDAGYATAHIGKWHLGGGRDVKDAPKFAAYGYDLGLGTHESPERAVALGIKTVPWSETTEPQQVKRHDRTRWMVDQTLAFVRRDTGRPWLINLWLVDFFPTLCALAAVPVPKGVAFDGEDMSAAFRGGTRARSRALFWEYGRRPPPDGADAPSPFPYPSEPGSRSPNVAVRDGRWKLLVNADGSRLELYDMEADPGESKNLAEAEVAVARRLRESALGWRKSLP